MRNVVIALALTLAAAAPSHIQPRHSPLVSLLRAYVRAQGTWTPGRPQTRVLHWSVTESDETGTETDTFSGEDYRVDRTMDGSTESHGSVGGHAWSENDNAEVVSESGIHERTDVDDRILAEAIAHPDSVPASVTFDGRVSQPFDASLIIVDPPGGVHEILYVDTTTSLLDERLLTYPGHTIAFTFGDYRTTLGLTFPWHIHENIDNGMRDIDMRLQDAQVGGPVDPSLVARPTTHSIVSFSQPTVVLPGKIVGDRIIIPVQLQSHTVNMQLDSGASTIVLDRSIVEALGYAEHGHITEQTAGAYVESDAVVPQLTVGGLSMQNVHVDSIPFESIAGDEPIAGLLGFDFLDCVVLHVDYADGTVTAISPQAFTPPPDAFAFPIVLDDQIPAVSADLGSIRSIRMLIDTGADRSILFSSFAREHSSAVVDQGLGTEMEAQSPFLGSFGGVGGSVSYRPLDIGPLRVGRWSFSQWLFYLTQDPSKFEIEDYDGILGQDFLRYYDLYLDYPHGRIYLAPNARYTERFAT